MTVYWLAVAAWGLFLLLAALALEAHDKRPSGPKPELRIRQKPRFQPCWMPGCAVLTASGSCSSHQRQQPQEETTQ